MLSITADCLRSRRHDVPRSEVFPLSRLAASSKTTSLMRYARGGFTLVELLTVIAIIGILSAITFGVVKGVNERAAIGQAKAELGTIAQALENYKRQYGDYPRTTSNAEMLQSLIGKLGPKGAAMNGKTFIDVAQFALSSANANPLTDATVKLIDPWGREYGYAYDRNDASWVNPSFVLFSAGPNGKSYGTTNAPGISALLDGNKGIVKSDAAENSGSADNIYAK